MSSPIKRFGTLQLGALPIVQNLDANMSLDDAKDWVKLHYPYLRIKSGKTSGSGTIYFECKYSNKKSFLRCEVTAKLIRTATKTVFWLSPMQHRHQLVKNPSRVPMNEVSMEAIAEGVAQHETPTAILKRIAIHYQELEINFPLPTLKQVQGAASRERHRQREKKTGKSPSGRGTIKTYEKEDGQGTCNQETQEILEKEEKRVPNDEQVAGSSQQLQNVANSEIEDEKQPVECNEENSV